MTSNPVDWSEQIATDPDLEYRTLVKSLRRTQGFGLFFVQCSPVEGERLIQKVRADLPQKHIKVLKLDQAIANLYDKIAELPNKDAIEILFIQGLELSLYQYEQDKLWNSSAERYGYSEGSVPKLLAHLNLSRERFRDHFNICFVFLVPLFALKYLMRRAPDFFDWRSGVLEFIGDPDRVQQESQRLWQEGDYEQYLTWTADQRNARILEIQALLEEPHLTNEEKISLLIEQGHVFIASQNYTAALAGYDRALKIKPDSHGAWYSRGYVLFNLGRNEDAIASYDQALEIKPDSHGAWCSRGYVLFNLGRNEEAIASFDHAIAIQPDDYQAWYNRGNALSALGRKEDAVTSYDHAIAIQPDDHQAWFNRGLALSALGRNEDAIASYDHVIAIQPDDYQAWYGRGNALLALGRNEDAVTSYDHAIAIQPDDHQAWWGKGWAFSLMQRFDEAINSYDKALSLQPDLAPVWYNKACCYALWGKEEEAIGALQRAIELNPAYREEAKTDVNFDGLRQNEQFQAFVAL